MKDLDLEDILKRIISKWAVKACAELRRLQ
jgi:hypothetical protein